jgi:Raf kinase inhibitor-like YbhB/YbcL family protein
MKVTSTSFLDNQGIPSLYTCDSSNVSPPLQISEVPDNAASLALIMDDPDAPNGTFTHWLIWNIDPATGLIPEGLTPDGSVRGENSMGHVDYDGPCPPSGIHRYHFHLYALDTKLDLQIGATRQDLENAMQGHIIDEAELVGLYSRNQS